MRSEDTEMASGESQRASDAAVTNLKTEINNLIWVHAPADMTLDCAEKLAIRIMNSILHGE